MGLKDLGLKINLEQWFPGFVEQSKEYLDARNPIVVKVKKRVSKPNSTLKNKNGNNKDAQKSKSIAIETTPYNVTISKINFQKIKSALLMLRFSKREANQPLNA